MTTISQIIATEPLVQGIIEPTVSTGTVFFGVGLCTSRQPAVAVPFDILAFFLVAELIRKSQPGTKVIVLIADTHATTNTFMTPRLIQTVKKRVSETLSRIIARLNLSDFRIAFASQLRTLPSFESVLGTLSDFENSYLRQEIADIIWLSRHENLVAKLGWSLNSRLRIEGHDERFFDLQLLPHLERPLQLIHLEAGRTLDPTRPKASPYVSVAGEKRILLKPAEPVREKLTGASPDVLRHLNKIVTLFERLFGPLPADETAKKVRLIIDRIMI